jgi:hypothetical protein
LAVTACAALATLAFAGSAWAAYAPRLVVASLNNAPGKPTTMVLGHVQEDADDPSAKDTIYAPPGYGVNLTQAVGAKLGAATADLVLRGSGNQPVHLEGQALIVDSPASHASDTCAPGLHAAVWRLNVVVAGTPLPIYVYVDPVTTGPEAGYASAKMQICLPGPIGTPSGAQFLSILFDVGRVFTNPANRADRIWRSTFTPYTPNTPNQNPAGTTEGQALVPGTVSLTLAAKSLKRGVVVISGRLLVDGKAFPGATVELYVGIKRIAKVTSNRSGRFQVRTRIKKKTSYRALTTFVADLESCPGTPIPGVPQGCKTATMSFTATSNTVTARRKR